MSFRPGRSSGLPPVSVTHQEGRRGGCICPACPACSTGSAARATASPEGPGLFGGTTQEPVQAVAYRVLARKYRPARFDDLIGQAAMVRILRNAFATGRIAHAFMLTGVRGVGKTTTARKSSPAR